MKTFLLTSTALLFAVAASAGATVLTAEEGILIKAGKPALMQLADKGRGGSDDNGSDDRGGSNSGSNSGSDDDDSDDDNSGASSDDNSSDTTSGSKRKKKRIPGGSGCDDAGDIAEHAECSPGNG